jgi:hypothetical protein
MNFCHTADARGSRSSEALATRALCAFLEELQMRALATRILWRTGSRTTSEIYRVTIDSDRNGA